MTQPPSSNESWIDTVFDAVVSDWQRTGYFSVVNKHEPRKKPNPGKPHACIWFQSITPLGGASGLASTSALVVFKGRIYWNTGNKQEDMIDPALMRAASNVIRRYHDDFDFGLDPIVRNIDIFGTYGTALKVVSGYLEQDDAMFRVVDIDIPVIVNDAWEQQRAS